MTEASLRWGILATGNIAASMAEALQMVPHSAAVAVASRSQASADAFGEAWGIPRRYGDYGSLMADPDVDVVYIATPHAFHHENVLSALRAGKHVLCEKPLTLNAAQARECADVAREHGLFLMEAVWMRFFPAIHRIRELVNDGAIGDVVLLQASFCIDVEFDPAHRLYSPDLGGGALLDLGIYPVSFATMLLGPPATIDGRASIGSTGVDETNAITLTFAGGAIAQLASSCRGYRPHVATIVGSRGRIGVSDFFHPHGFTISIGGRAEHRKVPGKGYVHEVDEVERCLRSGLTESPELPLSETIATMELMDGLRKQWGVVYPADSQSDGSHE